KLPVHLRLRQCGGLTGTALVAAARLGARCAYAGVLGSDRLSGLIRETFEREQIDLTHVHPRVDVPPIHSTIIVDESSGSRTILYEKPDDLGDEPGWPTADVIRSARVLFLDHKHAETMIAAA